MAPLPDATRYVAQINRVQGVNRVAHLVIDGGPKIRRLQHLAETGLGVQFRVHCNDVQTALRGILTRVFLHWEVRDGNKVLVPPFRPTDRAVRAILGAARSQLLRLCPSVTPLTKQEFLARYTGRKHKRYSDAANKVEEWPVTSKDATLQTFVKAEKLNVSAKPDPDPRVIQPRNVRFLYESGLYLKAIEPVIYRAIDRLYRSKTVMKGRNADARGRLIYRAWSSFVSPCAIGVDASRFDQHVSTAILKFVHTIYKALIHDSRFDQLLSWMLVNTGYVRCPDGSFKYTVDGSRMSGDMDTALANVLTMCLMMFAYLNTKPFITKLINDGDDCVIICEAEHHGQFADIGDWFQALGFIMKVEEPVFVLEQLVFCQTQPIEVSPGCYRMVRDPRSTLDKDLANVTPVQNQADFDYLRGSLGLCGLALAGDVPVYCEFYNSLCAGTWNPKFEKRRAEQGLTTGAEYLALGMHAKYQEPTVEARVSFWKAFGITPDEQVALEELYRGWRPVWNTGRIVFDVLDVFKTL